MSRYFKSGTAWDILKLAIERGEVEFPHDILILMEHLEVGFTYDDKESTDTRRQTIAEYYGQE